MVPRATDLAKAGLDARLGAISIACREALPILGCRIPSTSLPVITFSREAFSGPFSRPSWPFLSSFWGR